MARVIGRNVNQDGDAIVNDPVSVGPTAQTILPPNTDRLYVAISVRNRDVYVRFIPASEEPINRKGIFVPRNNTYELPTDNIYTGEISVIAAQGNQLADIYVTEF